ncbi:MAG TPA: adenylate/guanylate cyclase domain-containing protein [Acidimicrobiia bacterium]|nr:adenylate/guanylate cyclase domain-containing protein [Acidimicrobiia bacterium]
MVIGGVVVLAAVDYVKTLMSRVSPGVASVPASGLLLSTLAALVRFPEVVVSADAVGEARVLPSGDVTFMMTDIEGSTRMFRELGDAYVDVLETHNSLLRSAVAARGGVEVGTEGDSLLVAFSDPLDAVAACLESQLALAAHSWPPHVDVRVRMGVHTGEAHPVGHDYVALPLHQVARISAAAHGGQILVSQTTADLTRARLPEAAELVDLGAFQLRGFPAPERLFQLNHAGLRADFPPLRAMGVVSHNLPFHRNSFVGRSEERRALSGLLRTAGVLTLVGSGGVGKTRLAIQVAFDVMERFADGAWLVELAPLTSSDSVIRAVAAAIDVVEEPRRSIEDIVIEALADKSVLLVLDNCEHLLDTAAAVAERLSQRCPKLVILATSREPLDVEGEVVWRLEPLAIADPAGTSAADVVAQSDAVRLLVERAAQAQPGFSLNDDNAGVIADIVSHLNGIPLAIELAAAALAETSPEVVLTGLADRFSLLMHGRRTAPDRHQTLRGAIEWSLELLDPVERKLFERLSIFAGSWSTEAAAGIAGIEPVAESEVAAMLRHLSRASLLVTDQESPPRWSMLESIRELAALELGAEDETQTMSMRHRQWFAARTEAMSDLVGRRGQSAIMSELVADHDNIRRALDEAIEIGDAEMALRICAAMSPFWTSHGDWSEGIERIDAVLAIESDAAPAPRARALAGLGRLLLLTGDLDAARTRYQEAHDAATEAGDAASVARALSGLGYVAFRRSQLDEAEELWQEALIHADDAGDERVMAEVLRSLAIAAGTRGEQSLAGELIERAIAAARRAEDDQLLRQLLGSSAEMNLWLGNYQQAEDFYGDALDVATEIGDFSARPLLVAELGWVALLRGEPVAADRLAVESAELAEDLNNPRVLAHALRLRGEALSKTGDFESAATAFAEAREVAEGLNAPAELAGVLCSEACLALELQDFDSARSHAEEALALSALQHSMRLASPRWVLGAVALNRGDDIEAEAHFNDDLETAESGELRRHIANDLWGLAAVSSARGDTPEAVDRHWRALRIRHQLGDRLGMAESLLALAEMVVDANPGVAAEMVRVAGSFRAGAGAIVTPLQDERLARIRDALEERGIEEIEYETVDLQTLEVDQAIELAARVVAEMAGANEDSGLQDTTTNRKEQTHGLA